MKLVASLLVAAVNGRTIEISNVDPRMNADSEILSAHDGNLVQFAPGGDFHLFGMSYGSCQAQGCGSGDCGFQDTHNITLYTSPDLSQGSWRFQANILPLGARPQGIYYRPKVVFNAKTGLYVLWVNWLSNRRDFGSSSYLVATSETPAGPFKVVNEKVPTKFTVGGDFDLFVDDDGEAYFIYTSITENHGISIERLAPDYLSSTQVSTGILSDGACYEAPTMFKRDGLYYALYATCCCFCTEGDTRYVVTASSPLGFATSLPRHSLGNAGGAQENYVAQIATTQGTTYLWTGDRWNSAPDGVKDHDFQYWAPLEFGDAPGSGRFIRSELEAIYWEEAGVKYHVPSCAMCEGKDDPCRSYVKVEQSHIDGLQTGSEFTCDQQPRPPILPMQQLEKFSLELPSARVV